MKSTTADTTGLLLGKFSYLRGSIKELERVCLIVMALSPESYALLAERVVGDGVFGANFLTDFILAADEGEAAEVKLVRACLKQINGEAPACITGGIAGYIFEWILGRLGIRAGRDRRSTPC